MLPVTCRCGAARRCDSLVSMAMDQIRDTLTSSSTMPALLPPFRLSAKRLDQFRSVIEVNLMGSYWMAQACARSCFLAAQSSTSAVSSA